jgi:hypothetical protein
VFDLKKNDFFEYFFNGYLNSQEFKKINNKIIIIIIINNNNNNKNNSNNRNNRNNKNNNGIKRFRKL